MKNFTSAYQTEKNKSSNSPIHLMEIGLLTTLNGNIDAVATTIPVRSAIQYPSSGLVFLNKERITYSGKTDTSFTGCTRPANAASHSDGDYIQDGETLFLSDKKIEALGQHDYIARVLDWGSYRSEVKFEDYKALVVKIKLDNASWLDDPDYITNKPSAVLRENLFVRIFRLFEGLVSADLDQIFMGVITGDIDSDSTETSFVCTDIGQHFDKSIGTLLTAVSWPSIDRDYVNRIAPIIIGEVKNQVGIPVVAGAATTLAEESGIDDSSEASFLITDTTTFEDLSYPITVIIGSEEIRISGVNVGTSKLNVSGGGRGFGGTTATSHSLADGVFEKTAITYKLAETLSGHPLNEMTNFRILPLGMKVKDAIYIGGFSNTPNLVNGTVQFDDPIAIARKVAIEVSQQPGVNQQPAVDNQPSFNVSPQPTITNHGSHPHTASISGQSQTVLYGDGIASQDDVSSPSNAHDQNDTTYAYISFTWPDATGHLALNFDYSGFDGLKIKQAVACIRHKAFSGLNTWKLTMGGAYSQDLDRSGVAVTQKFIFSGSGKPIAVDETDWSKLDGLEAEAYDTDTGTHTASIYEIWWEIKYELSATVNSHAADGVATGGAGTSINQSTVISTADNKKVKIGEGVINGWPNDNNIVKIGGDSVADSIGGELIADMKGFEDDGSGTFTETPNALIQKPAHVIEFCLAKFTNNTILEPLINLASFANITAAYPGFTFNFAIRKKMKVNTLLSSLAIQTWARFFYSSSGEAVLSQIITTGSADKVLDQNDIQKKNNVVIINVREKQLNSVANRINILTDLNYIEGYWNDREAYAENTIDTSGTTQSVNYYGTHEHDFLFFAIWNNQNMADTLAELLKDYWMNPKQEVTIDTFLFNAEIEKGDIVDFSYSDMGINNLKYQVIKSDYLPFPFPTIQLVMVR